MIEYKHGDLLSAPVEALVNTVNTEGVMGKGIALQFRDRFPSTYFEHYRGACKAKRVHLGQMHVHDRGQLVDDGPRWIVNFPTKGHWRAKSRMADIDAGLQDLARWIRHEGIKSIALPPLGCGNGGLDWGEVKPLIERVLADLPVQVLVFEPKGAPPAARMVKNTERPTMSETRAILIVMMDRYLKSLLDPIITLLEVQKLMYFVQEAGQDLKLKFEANKYGPYADNLRFELNRMEGHYIVGFGDGAVLPFKELELLPGAVDEAVDFVAWNDTLNKRMDRVTHLIDGYEDAYGMELLSTLHWVMLKEPEARESVDVAILRVHAWSNRKRQLMKPEHLERAWTKLAKEDWNLLSAGIDRLSVV